MLIYIYSDYLKNALRFKEFIVPVFNLSINLKAYLVSKYYDLAMHFLDYSLLVKYKLYKIEFYIRFLMSS